MQNWPLFPRRTHQLRAEKGNAFLVGERRGASGCTRYTLCIISSQMSSSSPNRSVLPFLPLSVLPFSRFHRPTSLPETRSIRGPATFTVDEDRRGALDAEALGSKCRRRYDAVRKANSGVCVSITRFVNKWRYCGRAVAE